MADSIEVSFNADGLRDLLRALPKLGESATRSGVTSASTKLVARTRANISGEPRWARRGKGAHAEAFDSGRRPVHVPRDGGPGVLTGDLRRGVHKLKPRRRGNVIEGKVSAMGSGGDLVRNLYAAKLEEAYPFLAPARVGMDEVLHAALDAALDRAITRAAK